MENVPVLQVADADFFRSNEVQWDDNLRARELSDVVKAAFKNATGFSCEFVSDLLVGDINWIASIPEVELVDPNYGPPPNLSYVGPLIWDPEPDWRVDLSALAGRPRIYASVGRGDLTRGDFSDEALLCGEDAVALRSRGIGESRRSLKTPRVHAVGLGGLTRALEWADVSVSHGGHSSIIASLRVGVPVVVVPSMSENQHNGLDMVERNGLGVCAVRAVSCGDSWVWMHGSDEVAPAEFDQAIRDALSTVVADDAIRIRVRCVAEKLKAAERRLPQLVSELVKL
ncbi:glycosyltransferase [Nocardioides sp. SYSU D00038]|uniref:glycosyltransferase n=1 Tax=Nocardioides sp. SYSU D00038 TaxID=2812554 RepID=UPI0019686B16|nr:glycosyltransferase [Nocardioides sp. SYSU D00038]